MSQKRIKSGRKLRTRRFKQELDSPVAGSDVFHDKQQGNSRLGAFYSSGPVMHIDAGVQRKTADNINPEEEKLPVQEKSSESSTGTATTVISQSINSSTAGSPVPVNVRGKVEPVLGASLAHVQVHDDAQANAAAKSIHAKAFTHGSNIYLAAGQSPGDLKLMAHEATHVVQQAKISGTGNAGVIARNAEPGTESSGKPGGISATEESITSNEIDPMNWNYRRLAIALDHVARHVADPAWNIYKNLIRRIGKGEYVYPGAARRAAIAYQKLLTMMNLTNDSREGSQGQGLKLLRTEHANILEMLQPQLSKEVNFGVAGGSATSYFKSGSVPGRSGGLTEHSRIKGQLSRPGWSHRYGALDIFSSSASPTPLIVAKFRLEIPLDELPLPQSMASQIANTSTPVFKFKQAVVTDIQLATDNADLANRLLSGFKYEYKKAPYLDVQGRMHRGGPGRKWIGGGKSAWVKPVINRIESIGGWKGLQNIWAALYLRGTSALRDPESGAALQEFRQAFSSIEAVAFLMHRNKYMANLLWKIKKKKIRGEKIAKKLIAYELKTASAITPVDVSRRRVPVRRSQEYYARMQYIHRLLILNKHRKKILKRVFKWRLNVYKSRLRNKYLKIVYWPIVKALMKAGHGKTRLEREKARKTARTAMMIAVLPHAYMQAQKIFQEKDTKRINSGLGLTALDIEYLEKIILPALSGLKAPLQKMKNLFETYPERTAYLKYRKQKYLKKYRAMFGKSLADKNVKILVNRLVDMAMYTQEIPHVAFPREQLYKHSKVKNILRPSSSNKVAVSLVYANENYELRGKVGYGHLYVALPFVPYPGMMGVGEKNILPIGLLGTSGQSIAHHIHMSANFKLYARPRKKNDSILVSGPCSAIVYLSSK